MSTTIKHSKDETCTKYQPTGSSSTATEATTTNNQAVGHLENDYAGITNLLMELQPQLVTFLGTLNSIQNSMPANDGLTALWQEQARVLEDERPKSSATETWPVSKKPRLLTLDMKGIMNDIVSDNPEGTMIFLLPSKD
jgi:hypothetical protein